MPETRKQYAIFNVPVNPDAYVAPEDAWLFTDPIKTFDPGTPETSVFRTYNVIRKHPPRPVGLHQVESRLILKVRHVHYTDYVKVLGADAAKEQIAA